MAKYRFKTKEEFIRDDEWHFKNDAPYGWNNEGRMNSFLGEDIAYTFNSECDEKKQLFIGNWTFRSSNYVLKETTRVNKYTDFVFVPGNIYVGEWDSNRVIFKPTTACLDDPCYFISSTDEFRLNQRGCCNANNISFREANQEEKDWLEACIKANTTVPKPSNSIPEYVECVQEMKPYYGEKGKIYKVVNWNHSNTDCMLEGTTSGSTSKDRFKSSTKEAYDAQNTPLIDKWAIKCTQENKEHLEKFFHNKGSEYQGYAPSWNISTGHYYHYPQKQSGLWRHIEIQKGYREITTEEFYKIAGVVTEVHDALTFKVGRWYKYNNWYIKYKKHDKGFWTSSEEIDDDNNYRKTISTFGGFNSDHQKILLTDLSEIQPYLPDGHPDKIVEQKRFKKGDYIVITECNAKSYNGKLNHCYKLIGNNFNIGDYDRIPLDEPNNKKARLATPEEITEYNRLGKPYDVTTLLQKKAEQESFPKYVRIISDKNGQVYRVIDWTQHAYCVIESKSGKRLKPFKDLVSEAQEHEFYAVIPPKEMKKTVDFKSLSFEEWLEETKKLNLSFYDLQQHVSRGITCNYENVYVKIPGEGSKEKAEYLFNIWNPQKQSSMPLYVKCINGYGSACVGKIYRTDDDKQAKNLFLLTWEQVLIKYNHLGTKFIPVTYPEYSEYHSEKVEQSKPIADGSPAKKETLIEDVHSVSVMLSTKNKSKQFKF